MLHPNVYIVESIWRGFDRARGPNNFQKSLIAKHEKKNNENNKRQEIVLNWFHLLNFLF